jgi:hypothetical protein
VDQCSTIKPDGSRCRAGALPGKPFCVFHDPSLSDRRAEGRRKGGENRRAPVLPADSPDHSLTSVADVVALLGQTINQVRRGELDPRVGNTVGYLGSVLLRALDMGELERRLAALEDRLATRPTRTNGRVAV